MPPSASVLVLGLTWGPLAIGNRIPDNRNVHLVQTAPCQDLVDGSLVVKVFHHRHDLPWVRYFAHVAAIHARRAWLLHGAGLAFGSLAHRDGRVQSTAACGAPPEEAGDDRKRHQQRKQEHRCEREQQSAPSRNGPRRVVVQWRWQWWRCRRR